MGRGIEKKDRSYVTEIQISLSLVLKFFIPSPLSPKLSFFVLSYSLSSPALGAALALLCCTLSSLLCSESSNIKPKLIYAKEIISLVPHSYLQLLHCWSISLVGSKDLRPAWTYFSPLQIKEMRTSVVLEKHKTSKYPFQTDKYALYAELLAFSFIVLTNTICISANSLPFLILWKLLLENE